MTIKRFLMIAFFACLSMTLICGCQDKASGKKDVKYVFLLIGDGFGPNQRIMGELAAGKTLVMNTMSCAVPTGTNNVHGAVTDSAASGTAIACGVKSYNGAIGVDQNKQKLTSLAKILKNKGMSIGIISSCAMTDATPASQYAHQEMRSQKKEITADMAECGFDFFGGGNMASCAEIVTKNNKTEDEFRNTVSQNYNVVFDINQVKANSEKPYYLIAPPHACDRDCSADCSKVDLAQILSKAIDVLSTNEKGFYVMLECGRIDHSGHANDAGVTAREVAEFDQAVAVAMEFQKKYPEETLVIVTADHETGGLQIDDMEKLKANAKHLMNQKGYASAGSVVISSLLNQKVDSAKIYDRLCQHLGFSGFSDAQKKELIGMIESNYSAEGNTPPANQPNQIMKKAITYRDQIFGIRYTTGGHSSAKIITSVSGPGWEAFKRDDLENSSLKALIEQAMNLNQN